jgi:hypothetical protein
MTRKISKSQKPDKNSILLDLADYKELSQEEKTKIKQFVSPHIADLDELLEKRLVSILFRDNGLKLPREKRAEIILHAKQVYFQG